MNNNNNTMIFNSIKAFSFVAVVFGFVGLLTFFTGIIPLFAGSMGLLFVALSYRKGSPLTSYGRLGLLLSAISIILGVSLLLYSYYAVLLPMMNDPEYYNTMDLYYRNNFGISLDELFQGSFAPPQ